jgi:hypothetical protein
MNLLRNLGGETYSEATNPKTEKEIGWSIMITTQTFCEDRSLLDDSQFWNLMLGNLDLRLVFGLPET